MIEEHKHCLASCYPRTPDTTQHRCVEIGTQTMETRLTRNQECQAGNGTMIIRKCCPSSGYNRVPEDGVINWEGVHQVLQHLAYGLDQRALIKILEAADIDEADEKMIIVREYYCDCCEKPLNGFIQACGHLVGMKHAKHHMPTPNLQQLARNMERAWRLMEVMGDIQYQ